MKSYTTYIYSYCAAMVISLALSCTVSRDIQATQAPLPAQFANSNSDSVSVAELSWKNFFTDPVLQELIDRAIAKNYDMQIAIKNIEESELTLKQVKWNNVPEASLNVTASTDRPSDNSLTGLSLKAFGVKANHLEDYSANIAISWEADTWSKIKNQSRTALANYAQTEEAKKTVQTNIVAGVSQDYYNLLMLNAQLAIAKKNAALTDSTLNIIKIQFEYGQVTSLAVQQAQAQQLTAADLIPQFEQNITVQEDALSILTGELPAKIALNKTLDETPIPESLSTGFPTSILRRRPDVKSQEFILMADNAKVGITKAEMYPTLRITASGGINSYMASNWFNIPASLFGIAAGSVVQPLLQHKKLKTQYDIAIVEREKTVFRFRQTVLNAVGEVSDALVKINKLKLQQDITAYKVNTLQQATSNAGYLFKDGKADYLEVIVAQANVLASELELASIKRSQLSAASDLYIALGGGWN